MTGRPFARTLAVLITLAMSLLPLWAGEAEAQAGWFPAGKDPSGYEMGTDPTMAHTGKGSGFIKAKPTAKADGFGTLMQSFSAEKYRGKRVRFSGWVKAEGVTDWAGLWMRVDGKMQDKQPQMLAFDNMQSRPIKGTHDWKRFEVVLDVPEEAQGISFGILLSGGKGEVWLDDAQLEVVGRDVPTTGMKLSQEPQNLGFEN